MMRRITIITIGIMTVLSMAGCSEIKEPKIANQDVHKHWNSVQSRLKYQMAMDCFESAQLKPSHKYVREAIAMNPNDAAAYVLLARIQIERGEIATARDTLEESIRCGGDSPQIDYLQGLIAERYRQFDYALTWYRRAADREPMNAHYVVAVSETLVSLGRLNDALALTQERWTDFEQNATIRALAGGIFTRLGRYEEAADAYQEAARIASDDSLLQMKYGSSLIRAGRYEEACAILTALTPANTEPTASVLVDLGQCHMALNRPDEAKAIFRRAVACDPQNHIAWNALAQSALALDDLLTARHASTQALELQPGHAEHALLLAYVCWRQNDFKSAGTVLNEILKQQPNDPVALYLKNKVTEAAGHTQNDQPRDFDLQRMQLGMHEQSIATLWNDNRSVDEAYASRYGSARAP